MKPPAPIAFVVPRCGLEVVGGAETQCLQVAQRMARKAEVEILTTCAQDYMTWQNAYAPGMELLNGLVIRRFPVSKPRNVPAFDCMTSILHDLGAEATIEIQEAWMRAQGPLSPELALYLRRHGADYRAVIFFPYQYATTYFNLPQVAGKSILAPCAHDDWCIRFSMWDAFFRQPASFLYNTPEERDFLRGRFPSAALSGVVAGVGVEPPASAIGDRFRCSAGIEGPILLYVGRIEESKGCLDLVDHFLRLKQGGYPGKLVLLGRAWMSIPNHPDILALGFVAEQNKWDALDAADWLIMPSPYESLSIVMLEAWAAGTPTLCRAGSDVLVGQTRRAQGGLWYEGAEEFVAVIQNVGQEVRQRLGSQGREHVLREYAWERVIQVYHEQVQKIGP